MPQAFSLLLQALLQLMLLLQFVVAGESVPDRQFDGTTDDVWIYNHLPFSDIKTIYNFGTTLLPPSSSTKGLIGGRVRVSSGTLNAGLSRSTGETLLRTQITNGQGTVAGGPTDGYGYHLENINYDTETDRSSVEDFLATEPPSPLSSSESVYYVAKNGDDSNSGTSLGAPFQTIQKCASVMIQGNTCYIRAGTYRETITPANSGIPSAPIAFQPYDGESVTISGADVISGWSVYSGAIYESSNMNWDLGQGRNQIFVDGQMMTEARWPNTGTDLLRPTWGVAIGGTSDETHSFGSPIDPAERWSITDPALNQPAGFWNGAFVTHMSNTGWYAQSGIVTSSTPGNITFSLIANRYGVGAGTRYYLWGKLAALDTAREWFYDPSVSSLYLWMPAGDSPSSHTVEAKRRLYAFDLSGKSNINIGAFNIFASTITTDMNSSQIVIDGINAAYPSHFAALNRIGQFAGWDTGIILKGSNNTLKNCTVAYSAGNGVDIVGTNHKVTNCIIHNVSYSLASSGIHIHSRGGSRLGLVGFPNSGHEISYNTLYNSALSMLSQNYAQGLKIVHNHMYNAGLQGGDLGFIYTWGTDGGGTEIAYNLLHDAITNPSGSGKFAPPGWGIGIYLDNGSSNFLIHHNVVWNTPGPGIFINDPSTNVQVYNNTLWNNSQISGRLAIEKSGSFTNIKTYNNLTNKGFVGTDLQNNLETSNPFFLNAAQGNFQLQSSSPARDRGRVISGITDGYIGSAPDVGAYEFGVQAWTAGANTGTPTPDPPISPLPIENSTKAQEQQPLILQTE
jgi:Right handed beta helix region